MTVPLDYTYSKDSAAEPKGSTDVKPPKGMYYFVLINILSGSW